MLFKLTVGLGLALSCIAATSTTVPAPGSECPSTISTAFVDSHHLIDKYFNESNGRLIGGSVWTDAVGPFSYLISISENALSILLFLLSFRFVSFSPRLLVLSVLPTPTLRIAPLPY
jgi:hypothetical protein